MSSTSSPSSSSSPPPRLPFVLLSLVGFLVGYACRLAFSILVTVLDAGFTRWKRTRNEEMSTINVQEGRRPSSQEDQSDSFSLQGLSSSSSEWSLRSLPSNSDYSDIDLVHIAGESTSTFSSPTSSPQYQKSGSGNGGRRKRWNSAEEPSTTNPLEQVGDQLLHLPSSTTINDPTTTSANPPPLQTSSRRSRSTSADSTLFRRRTFAFQPNDVPYPRYVDSFQPSYVEETPSPSPATPLHLNLPTLSPPLAPPPPQPQIQARRRRALSDSHLFPSSSSSRRSSRATTSSLHARAHPATYLAYWLDLADSTSTFDSSNDSQEEEDENISDEEEGSFDDDHHDGGSGMMLNSDSSDEDEDMGQEWDYGGDNDNDNASLPSTTSSSFHLSTLFEDSDSDEDDATGNNVPMHIEHYSPSPPPPPTPSSSSHLQSNSNSPSGSLSTPDGRTLLPPFTQDRFLTFLADQNSTRQAQTSGSPSRRPPSRTRTGVYPVTIHDESSSSEDDSDSDDDDANGRAVVRLMAERTVRGEEEEPWRAMQTPRPRPREEMGGGFESGNSLGLEMWLQDQEGDGERGRREEFEAWRRGRSREEGRYPRGGGGDIEVDEDDEDMVDDDEEGEEGGQFSPPPSPHSSFASLPSQHQHTHRPRQRYKKVLVDLGLRLTPHLSSPFSEILAEKWRLCEVDGQVLQSKGRLGGSPLRFEVVF